MRSALYQILTITLFASLGLLTACGGDSGGHSATPARRSESVPAPDSSNPAAKAIAESKTPVGDPTTELPLPAPEVPVTIFEAPEELDATVKNFPVTCVNGCPESSGTLLITQGLELKVCSFSLVGSDVILTNRHCIPEGMDKGQSCEGLSAIFMKKNGTKESYGCDKVLSLAEALPTSGLNLVPDYAYLKLKRKPSRTPLKISQRGVQDKEVLQVLTSTPNTKKNGTILVTKSCNVHMNSNVDRTFVNGFTPNIVLKNCDIVGGNSGSALLNSAGELVGLAQGSFAREMDKIAPGSRSKFQSVLYNQNFALATNVMCTENHDLGLNLQYCDRSQPRNNMVSIPKSVQDEFNLRLQAVQNDLNLRAQFMRFRITTTNTPQGDVILNAIPYCIKGSAKNIPWLQNIKTRKTQNPVDGYPNESSDTVVTTRQKFQVDYDDDARASIIIVTEPYQLNYIVPTKQIAKQEGGTFQVFKVLKIKGQMAKESYNVKMCE